MYDGAVIMGTDDITMITHYEQLFLLEESCDWGRLQAVTTPNYKGVQTLSVAALRSRQSFPSVSTFLGKTLRIFVCIGEPCLLVLLLRPNF
jgi:hypothetical protein